MMRCQTLPAMFTIVLAMIITPVSAGIPLEALANMAYQGIYEQPVMLANGLYEGEPFVAGGSARPRVQLLAGLYAAADIDRDGTEDAWVLLSESSGGTGQFLYLAAVLQLPGGPHNIGTLRIGDRVDVMALSTENGTAVLEYVTTGPGEAACCPTLMTSGVYGLRDGRLVQLSHQDKGKLSLQTLEGIPWQLSHFAWDDAVPTDILITARFEGDRISGSGGCNRYFATIEATTPYQLKIGPVGATRMACPSAQMAAEGRFLKALDAATQFSFVLGKLAVAYELDAGLTSLLFERSDKE